MGGWSKKFKTSRRGLISGTSRLEESGLRGVVRGLMGEGKGLIQETGR